MAYKVIILYQLYMPSYFLGTFTEYPQYKSTNLRLRSISMNQNRRFIIKIPEELAPLACKTRERIKKIIPIK